MTLTTTHLAQLSELAQAAALAAGTYIQSQFESEYVKRNKMGGDTLASQVVTEVDFKAQEIILDHLQDSIHTYDLGLLTEEAADDQSRLQKDYFWCIDPLDGTLPFMERRTGYAVSIALVSKGGDPVVGAVCIPDKKECYAAYTGSGVYLNDQPFIRNENGYDTLHFYMDRSFLSAPHYEWVNQQFQRFIDDSSLVDIQHHSHLGGVCNAMGVLSANRGCYLKFPKGANGCGSIWDYAATQLFMQEVGLPVSNARGGRLHLNAPGTSFMNRQGILYATDPALAAFVVGLGKEWGRPD